MNNDYLEEPNCIMNCRPESIISYNYTTKKKKPVASLLVYDEISVIGFTKLI